MNCQLRWTPNATVSALHAACLLDAGIPLVDGRLSAALSGPVDRLTQLVNALRIPRWLFWQHTIPVAGSADGSRYLAETVLKKTRGPVDEEVQLIETLSGCFRDLADAEQRAIPDGIHELKLRIGPLRQQWESRGPGMLHVIGRLTDPSLIVPDVNVFVVQPALGGAGAAHLSYNSVRIEAVLANPLDELPETARLSWLASQLNNDLPVHGEHIPGPRLPLVSGLAMILPVLHAAHEVELIRDVQTALPVAIENWLAGIGTSTPETVGIVAQWWQVYSASKPAWNVALGALDKMLRRDETGG